LNREIPRRRANVTEPERSASAAIAAIVNGRGATPAGPGDSRPPLQLPVDVGPVRGEDGSAQQRDRYEERRGRDEEWLSRRQTASRSACERRGGRAPTPRTRRCRLNRAARRQRVGGAADEVLERVPLASSSRTDCPLAPFRRRRYEGVRVGGRVDEHLAADRESDCADPRRVDVRAAAEINTAARRSRSPTQPNAFGSPSLVPSPR
jgi:hypothetical protein